MVHKSIRESRELLYELKLTEVDTPSVAKVWGEGLPSHRALVAYLSASTTGGLVPHTKREGRLIRDENKDTGGEFDTFEKVLKHFMLKEPQFTITQWVLEDSNPPYEDKVGSKKYDCLRIVVKKKLGEIQPGVYVVPYAANKLGKKFLFTNQILGAGAEHAVWAAMLNNPVVSDFLLKDDNRIGRFWGVSSSDDKNKFMLYCNYMAEKLAALLKWNDYGLEGVGDPPGKGSTTAAFDLKGKGKGEDGKDKQYNISVKYGDTQRLGAVRLDLNKPEDYQEKIKGGAEVPAYNSSVVYKRLQGELVQLPGKNPPADYDTFLSSVSKASDTDLSAFYKVMSDKDFETLLVTDVKTILGISEETTETTETPETLLVKFTEVKGDNDKSLTGGDPSVTMITGSGKEVKVTVERPFLDGVGDADLRRAFPVSRGRMYLVKVKKDNIEATLEVELGAKSQDKAVMLHIKKGDEKKLEAILAPPSMSESRQRKPRRSEASTTASVLGVTVPLGSGPDGKPATGDSKSKNKILSKNAKVQGQSWGNAKPLKLVKPINETRDLLEHLFEE